MSHPFPSTYCPGGLTGDLPRRGGPPPHRGPAAPSTLRPNWPYHCDPLSPPVPCHRSVVTEPGHRQRTAVGPHRRSSSDQFTPCHPPPSAISPPSGTWARAHDAVPVPTTSSPHRSPAGGPSGPPARAPALGLAESPPAQLAGGTPFLFLFLFYFFSFPIFVYMYIY
jgi:hypothetical protein